MIGQWFAGIWLKVAFAAVFVAMLLMAVLRLIGIGRKTEQADQARRNIEARRDADEAERMVDRAGDGELDELRKRWTRSR
jgi:hypothetical protein